ncbi:MAG TPA: YfaZ family outer membrane protein [Gammaproteobacteria bacterium]
MSRSRIILFSMLFFLPFSAQAASLDFNISDEAFLARFTNDAASGNMRADYGLLRQEENDVYVGSLGLHLVDNAGTETSPLQVGLGGRLQFIETDPASGAAISLGAWARYNLSGANRFAIAGSVHFAPSVTSFGDVENYIEYDIRGEYEVLRNGSLYLGYRKVETDFEGIDDVDLDKGLHFGMRFTF